MTRWSGSCSVNAGLGLVRQTVVALKQRGRNGHWLSSERRSGAIPGMGMRRSSWSRRGRAWNMPHEYGCNGRWKVIVTVPTTASTDLIVPSADAVSDVVTEPCAHQLSYKSAKNHIGRLLIVDKWRRGGMSLRLSGKSAPAHLRKPCPGPASVARLPRVCYHV